MNLGGLTQRRDGSYGKKEQVDILLLNGLVLTIDPASTIFSPGAIAVRAGKIVAVGPSDLVCAAFESSETLDISGCVALPGLINSHTHAAMTLFRGLADDLPLMEWLHGHIFPAEKKLTEKWVYWGTMLACAEMIRSGTTGFCDMYLFEHKVAEAAKKAGVRALVGEVLYDFPSPCYGEIENGLRHTELLVEKWRGDPLVSVAVEPHSLYTCSPDLLKKCGRMSARFDVPLVVHLSENEAEVKQVMEMYGRRPVAHLETLGMLNARLIADHCVALDDTDIELLAQNRVNVVHNPKSNMKLASGICPVPRLLQAGATVALGADGCASNNTLDMFAEMGMCAKLHKVNGLDPTLTSAQTTLRMATVSGADALGWGGKTGQIASGLLADLIVVDFRKPNLTPVYNPVSHLVYAAGAADVRHTIINGRLVMKDRVLLTLDLEEIFGHVREFAKMMGAETSAEEAKSYPAPPASRSPLPAPCKVVEAQSYPAPPASRSPLPAPCKVVEAQSYPAIPASRSPLPAPCKVEEAKSYPAPPASRSPLPAPCKVVEAQSYPAIPASRSSLPAPCFMTPAVREVDLLLFNADWLVACDPAMSRYRRGAVAIEGERIAAVGPSNELCNLFRGRREIDLSGCLLMPGLVNSHTHAGMSIFRGIADDLPLKQWLEESIFPLEKAFVNPDSVYLGVLLSAAEMLKSGTTCFCDGYFFEDAAARGCVKAGIRAVLGQGIVDFPTPDVPNPANSLAHAEDFLREFPSRAGLIRPSLFCHAPYTCSPLTLKKTKDICRGNKILFQTHLSETRQEVEQITNQYGLRPAMHLGALGVLDDLTLCAHAIWLSPSEIRLIAQSSASISHCPESNMKLASGVAPIAELAALGVKIGLGTDGCASNNDLDLLSEAGCAARLHKVFTKDALACPAEMALRMATTGSASALGLQDEIGSIEPGKKADLVALDLLQPHLTPLYDPVSHIVYAARGGDVRFVWVDGRMVVENRKLPTVDEAEILLEAKRMGEKILAFQSRP
ncbi:MAG: amidohydrolase family protein [Syntrophobacteraceae bacterium]|nr:amidohydrolase family protein [Syntrophobacteraceae bacterium]